MIKILSYGSGNVKAILNIYKKLNIECEIAYGKTDLSSVTKMVLPGVGAFDETMTQLKGSGMMETLDHLVTERKIPVLGICVGMQIMANASEEGSARGLGWIDGSVRKLDTSSFEHKPHLPHMGWNDIVPKHNHPILENIDAEEGFYFLHSYYFACSNDDRVLASSFYGGEFASAVYSDNIFGFQFHPEKSHENGVSLFKNFAEL